MNNLEWLIENELDFVLDFVAKAGYCRYCAFEDDCDGSMGSDDPKCLRGNREWLMAEHEIIENAENHKQRDETEGVDCNDSREKLEADVRDFVDYNGWFDENGWSTPDEPVDCKPTIKELFIGWLDRQAAITERETIDKWDMTAALRIAEQDRAIVEYAEKNAELQAKLDEYDKAAQGEFVVPLEDAMRFTTDPPGYVKARIAKLQAKVDELTAQLRESNAERERLRGCLGIAADHAHDFLALVDESGNVYDRDEGLA